MYILCDLEWVVNHKKYFCATQLAAMRVDEAWTNKGVFFFPIEPLGPSFHLWHDPAFAGRAPHEFLNAQNAYAVFSAFSRWLGSEDVLCWWDDQSMQHYVKLHGMLFKRNPVHKNIVLNHYIKAQIEDEGTIKGSPYKLLKTRGVEVQGDEHNAENDVWVMCRVLQYFAFQQETLHLPPGKRRINRLLKPDRTYLYYGDLTSQIFHRSDCELLTIRENTEGYDQIVACIRRGFTPCRKCVYGEVIAWRKEKNLKSIEHTDYQFVFAKDGHVFHKRDCRLVLSAKEISGCRHFSSCYRIGLTPCKICRPKPLPRRLPEVGHVTPKNNQSPVLPVKKKKQKIRFFAGNHMLSTGEIKAMERYIQARREREQKCDSENMSAQAYRDHLTLTQPGYMFFSAKGYSAFHKRSCGIIERLSYLDGYATYKQACRSGKQPCKICKPDPKDDLELSIPITNEIRKGETTELLEKLCAEHGYISNCSGGRFMIQTPVGKWRIHAEMRPVHVDHINLVKTPHNENQYHRQPRLFLSLKDAFSYIERHDRTLEENNKKEKPGSAEESARHGA